VIPRDTLNAEIVATQLRSSSWTLAAKIGILEKKPAIGFTRAQVDLALGKPTTEASEENATGITDVLVYPGMTITMKAGKVVSIKTIK
jgi:hypothetical protein